MTVEHGLSYRTNDEKNKLTHTNRIDSLRKTPIK